VVVNMAGNPGLQSLSDEFDNKDSASLLAELEATLKRNREAAKNAKAQAQAQRRSTSLCKMIQMNSRKCVSSRINSHKCMLIHIEYFGSFSGAGGVNIREYRRAKIVYLKLRVYRCPSNHVERI
jgi:hypothetical protein